MAKLIPSSLVQSIHKSLGGSTFNSDKGNTIIRSRRKPRNPRTADQQRLRGITSRLSGMYYSLSNEQKELWNKYASMLKSPLSGFNAFCGLNARLLKTKHADLNIIYAPPPYPSTPESITGHSLLRIAETTMRYEWLSPQTQDDYVYLEWATQAGYDMTGKETWHKVDVVRSDQDYIEWENTYGLEIPIHTRARTIDKQGRVSPWTAINQWEHGVPAPIDANTMLYLPMNENIGFKVMDHSGHINNGTIYGASWTTGIEKYALSLDGLDDYVDCEAKASLNFTNAITIGIWVNPKLLIHNHRLLSRRNYPEYTTNFASWIRPDGKITFLLYTTEVNLDMTSINKVVINQWSYVVLVYVGDTGYIYINGVADSDASPSGNINAATVTLFIGQREDGAENYNGLIDEVRISNRALSTNEIYDHYIRLKPL